MSFDKLQTGSAAEIGKRINNLERRMRLLIPGSPQLVDSGVNYWYAKIDTNHEDGTYDCTEQIINEDGDAFEDKEGGRKWVKDGSSSNLKQARELNSDETLVEEDIVLITRVHKSKHGVNDWVIISAPAPDPECEVIFGINQEVFNAHVDTPTDPVLYEDLTKFTFAVCIPPPACQDVDCPAVDGDGPTKDNPPSLELTMFKADYIGPSIIWCFLEWTAAEIVAGTSKCACPTDYVDTRGYAQLRTRQKWYNTGGVDYGFDFGRYAHFPVGFANVYKGRVSAFKFTRSYKAQGGFVSNAPTTLFNAAGNPIATFDLLNSPQTIPDVYFFTYIEGVFGIELTWARGERWT